MIKIIIIIRATDVEEALPTIDLIQAQLNDGYVEGFNRNEDGSYRFEVEEIGE